MKNTMKVIVVVGVLLGVGMTASADEITLGIDIGYLYSDASGDMKLPNNSLGAIVVDTDGSGWDAYMNGIEEGTFTVGGVDTVLDVFGTDTLTYGEGTHVGVHKGDITEADKGKSFALFWFNMDYTSDAETTGPAKDVSYGFYTDASYIVPEQGTITRQTFTIDTTAGSVSDSMTTAPYTVVPEPFTMGVLAIGGLAMLRRRRVA